MSKKQQNVKKAIDRGSKNFTKGEYNQAMQDFEVAATLDPRNYMVKIYAGLTAIKLKDFEQAENYFLQGKELGPDKIDWKRGLCELYAKFKPKQSIKLYYEIIEYFEGKKERKSMKKNLEVLLKTLIKLGDLNELEQFGLYLLTLKVIKVKTKAKLASKIIEASGKVDLWDHQQSMLFRQEAKAKLLDFVLKQGKPSKEQKQLLIPAMIDQLYGIDFPTKYLIFRLDYIEEDAIFEYDKQFFWIFLSDPIQLGQFLNKFLIRYQEKLDLHQQPSIEEKNILLFFSLYKEFFPLKMCASISEFMRKVPDLYFIQNSELNKLITFPISIKQCYENNETQNATSKLHIFDTRVTSAEKKHPDLNFRIFYEILADFYISQQQTLLKLMQLKKKLMSYLNNQNYSKKLLQLLYDIQLQLQKLKQGESDTSLKDILKRIITEYDQTYIVELIWIKFSNNEVTAEQAKDEFENQLKEQGENLSSKQKALVFKRLGTLYFIMFERNPSEEELQKKSLLYYAQALKLDQSDYKVLSAIGLNYQLQANKVSLVQSLYNFNKENNVNIKNALKFYQKSFQKRQFNEKNVRQLFYCYSESNFSISKLFTNVIDNDIGNAIMLLKIVTKQGMKKFWISYALALLQMNQKRFTHACDTITQTLSLLNKTDTSLKQTQEFGRISLQYLIQKNEEIDVDSQHYLESVPYLSNGFLQDNYSVISDNFQKTAEIDLQFNLRYQLIQMKKLKGNISGAQSLAEEAIEFLESDKYSFKAQNEEEDAEQVDMDILIEMRNKLYRFHQTIGSAKRENNEKTLQYTKKNFEKGSLTKIILLKLELAQIYLYGCASNKCFKELFDCINHMLIICKDKEEVVFPQLGNMISSIELIFVEAFNTEIKKMIKSFPQQYVEHYFKEFGFIQKIKPFKDNRYSLKTISDYYFNLQQVQSNAMYGAKSQNLDFRICQLYENTLDNGNLKQNVKKKDEGDSDGEDGGDEEELRKVKVEFLNDINGFMTSVNDCYLHKAILKEQPKEINKYLQENYDMTFIKLFQTSKYWLWQSIEIDKENQLLQINEETLLMNILLFSKDYHSLNLLGLIALLSGSHKKALKLFIKSILKNNKSNPNAFLAMSIIACTFALKVKPSSLQRNQFMEVADQLAEYSQSMRIQTEPFIVNIISSFFCRKEEKIPKLLKVDLGEYPEIQALFNFLNTHEKCKEIENKTYQNTMMVNPILGKDDKNECQVLLLALPNSKTFELCKQNADQYAKVFKQEKEQDLNLSEGFNQKVSLLRLMEIYLLTERDSNQKEVVECFEKTSNDLLTNYILEPDFSQLQQQQEQITKIILRVLIGVIWEDHTSQSKTLLTILYETIELYDPYANKFEGSVIRRRKPKQAWIDSLKLFFDGVIQFKKSKNVKDLYGQLFKSLNIDKENMLARDALKILNQVTKKLSYKKTKKDIINQLQASHLYENQCILSLSGNMKKSQSSYSKSAMNFLYHPQRKEAVFDYCCNLLQKNTTPNYSQIYSALSILNSKVISQVGGDEQFNLKCQKLCIEVIEFVNVQGEKLICTDLEEEKLQKVCKQITSQIVKDNYLKNYQKSVNNFKKEDYIQISKSFEKESNKLSFLAQAIDMTVRKSSSPKRILLLENLNNYIAQQIPEDDQNDDESEVDPQMKNIRNYITCLIYTESLKDMFNPEVQEDEDADLENKERLYDTSQQIVDFSSKQPYSLLIKCHHLLRTTDFNEEVSEGESEEDEEEDKQNQVGEYIQYVEKNMDNKVAFKVNSKLDEDDDEDLEPIVELRLLMNKLESIQQLRKNDKELYKLFTLNRIIYQYELLSSDNEKLPQDQRKEFADYILQQADQLLTTVKESYLRSFILNIKGKTELQIASKNALINRNQITRNFKLAILHTPSLGSKIIPNLTKQ